MASSAGRAVGDPVTSASQSLTNHDGGHHNAPAGWRPSSGRAPTVTMNSAACTNWDTRMNQRPGTRFNRMPCTASRLKKTKLQPPASAAKVALPMTGPEGFSIQRPEMTQAKNPASGPVSDSTKTPASRTRAVNFATKICRALTGNPASAR